MVVCIGQPSIVYVLWVHCDVDLMIFLEEEGEEQEDGVGVSGRLPACRTSRSAAALISKMSTLVRCPTFTLSLVENPRCPKGAKPYHAVRSSHCPKSTLSNKKSQSLAGILLDQACESEASHSSGRVP